MHLSTLDGNGAMTGIVFSLSLKIVFSKDIEKDVKKVFESKVCEFHFDITSIKI